MKPFILLKNVTVVNEGRSSRTDMLIGETVIQKIGTIKAETDWHVIDGTGKHAVPGVIDTHVHFRDPGLTHKGDLYTESKAALAGGVTSFIEMPNSIPTVLTGQTLADKYAIASVKSVANYAFFLGVTKENIDDLLKTDTTQYIGVSDDGLYFSGKGNLLADNPDMMEKLFATCKCLIAIHSELEQVIEQNEHTYREKYGDTIPIEFHPKIRSTAACYEATKRAIDLAKKYNVRLHILHLTTEAETHLFQNTIPLKEKKITTEVTVQHLWFSASDYRHLGSLIKMNPAIKTENDKKALLQALLDDRIDIIATDHAPHTLYEKQRPYFQSLSGMPMIQHSLPVMLEFYKQGLISLEKIVEKMCHNPAILYRIDKRGFIKEGYFADLTLVDLEASWTVTKENSLYKCGWSPLEGTTFQANVTHTFVNGNLVYENGRFNDTVKGQPLTFINRDFL